MPSHPSIQGLREAVDRFPCSHASAAVWCTNYYSFGVRMMHPECMEAAQAAYLTEHGVGWFGEGLVQVTTVLTHNVGD